jgi:predicted NAD/FAD-dependent oxidoreductase
MKSTASACSSTIAIRRSHVTDAIVVGGGICGVACASSLAAAGVPVTVRDRGRRLAGRMASRTLRDTGTAWDGRVVDIGAAYFTASDPDFIDEIDRLVQRGVVRPWTTSFHVAGPGGIEGVSTGPLRYAAAGGLRSVVEALADVPGVRVQLGDEVTSIDIRDGRPVVDGVAVDAAGVCVPEPQARRLTDALPESQITWEPVIAVTMVFDERRWQQLDGVFVNDDPVLTWVADDGSRRGDDAPVLVAHVSPVLAALHLDDATRVVPLAVATVQRLLGVTTYPEWVDAHRWTYAKPMAAREESYWLHDDVPLGAGGDAWAGGPRVEAAWLSGHRLGEALAARLASS